MFGIVYGLRGSANFDLDGPYESREAAMDSIDSDRLKEYGGAAAIVKASEHSAGQDAPFDPGAEVDSVKA